MLIIFLKIKKESKNITITTSISKLKCNTFHEHSEQAKVYRLNSGSQASTLNFLYNYSLFWDHKLSWKEKNSLKLQVSILLLSSFKLNS